ncbi:hypothetical protein FRC11_004403, partial [Ceratobasidium sp. 423]
ASKDADSVENFLLSDLSVPPSQITNLRNEGATRSGILAAFDQLRRNPKIVPLDPIIIYYAGHGCEVDTPSTDWVTHEEKTQCLVPWDAGTEDADGNPIPPIPDYTIATLLYALAAEKGNNITVIFDCCHSASSTRGIQQMPYSGTHPGLNAKLSKWTIDKANLKLASYRARRLYPEDLPRLTREVDMEILQSHMHIHQNMKVAQPSSRNTPPDKNLSGFRRFGRSHILLAACGHAEIAYECATSDSGYFTTALLERLRSSRIHKLTYKVCFEDFPQLLTPRQNPVCEGDDSGRLFFSATVPKGCHVFVPMQQLTGGYVLKAGVAQGVIPGSTYGIYEDDAFDEELQPERAQLQMYRLDQAGPTPVPLENGVATLTVSAGDIYGFRLKSVFNRRLYAYLFYFSTTSQSIKPLFLSVYGAGHVDAPLEANGELTIGYGNDDMISGPLSFRPAPDVGYFKLFLTTLPGDFDSMTQPSPFVEPDKIQTTSFGNGDEYSDGIEIRRAGSIDHNQGASRKRLVDLSNRLDGIDHSAVGEVSNFHIDGDIAPAFDSTNPQDQYHKKMLVTNRAIIGLPPRVLTDSETSARFDRQDIWDIITLKVVLRSAS